MVIYLDKSVNKFTFKYLSGLDGMSSSKSIGGSLDGAAGADAAGETARRR